MSANTKDARIAKLKAAAQRRKSDAFERAERAIRKLLLSNERLSFANVARKADVSIAYLYKYPELKNRIQELRAQQEKCGVTGVKPPPASDRSKQAMIQQLRQRIKELEAEREEQRKQVTALTGQLYEQEVDRNLITRLREDNARLSKRVDDLQAKLADKSCSSVVGNLSPSVAEKLSKLDIRLTPSITEKLSSYSEAQVMKAISVVEEASRGGNVRSKAGLLISALGNSWETGCCSLEKKRERTEFSKWFDAARTKGLVKASQGTNSGIIVLTSEGDWLPYELLRQKEGWNLSNLTSA